MGFGPVEPETDEPWFHADWERRAFGLTLAMGASGAWNLDMSRFARESLHPADYLASSYYEIWLKGLEKLLLAKGLVSAQELEDGRAVSAQVPVGRVLRAEEVPALLERGGPTDRTPEAPARFGVSEPVVTRIMNPYGHTRLPGYARGKRGVVEAVRGVFVFPDTNAHGRGECPQWLYTVAFTGPELWGAEADPSLVVSIDAWESYLEPA